jgi:hypothetical protein
MAEDFRPLFEPGKGVVELVGGLVLEVLWGTLVVVGAVVAGGATATAAGVLGGVVAEGTACTGSGGSAITITGSGHFWGAGIVNIIGIH